MDRSKWTALSPTTLPAQSRPHNPALAGPIAVWDTLIWFLGTLLCVLDTPPYFLDTLPCFLDTLPCNIPALSGPHNMPRGRPSTRITPQPLNGLDANLLNQPQAARGPLRKVT